MCDRQKIKYFANRCVPLCIPLGKSQPIIFPQKVIHTMNNNMMYINKIIISGCKYQNVLHK